MSELGGSHDHLLEQYVTESLRKISWCLNAPAYAYIGIGTYRGYVYRLSSFTSLLYLETCWKIGNSMKSKLNATQFQVRLK